MKASRLLAILTTLQARGGATAPQLAAQNEVSLRTIYRDIDALSAAGIPVYAERGSDGGYRLLDGYRTRLNGLSPKEAEALVMIGLSGPAADLGMGSVVTSAHNKLLSAMVPQSRASAEQMHKRFHLDAPAWFAKAEQPAHLPLVAGAVWDQRLMRMRYRSWKAEKQRVVAPLGIVLKSGAWYLVGQVDGSARTYRISRMSDLVVLDQSFERPVAFDLEAYWKDSTRRLDADMHNMHATVRLSSAGVQMLEAFLSPFAVAATQLAPQADARGWRTAVVPVGSVRQGCMDLLRFGAELEVEAPPELRAMMAEITATMSTLYRGAPAKRRRPGARKPASRT